MKERPILFTGPMVRAILEGRKTVTRRVVKPQPDFLGSMVDPNTPFKTLDAGLHARITCPHGQPGDRLWVREAWAADAQVDAIAPRDLSQGEPIWYPADFSVRQTGCSMISKGRGRPLSICRVGPPASCWRSPPLQDISEEQALAEGVHGEPCDHARQACSDIGCWGDTAKGAFGFLWEQLNGAGAWQANPWVWVVEFKRVTP
ncbi:hypothetical protein [Pseudomonas aeruginosa]|uniref:hypothetical protein n=1 Tax=Pseudomonas aeruginosa TaxID=287 RepID=UPI0039F4AFAA